jgi:hypothetical protein
MRELCRTRLSGLPLPASRKLALRTDHLGSLNSCLKVMLADVRFSFAL